MQECPWTTQRSNEPSSSPRTPTTPTSARRAPSRRWTAPGIEVAYCIITSGDAGGFDPTVPRGEIPGIREAEQRAAAAAGRRQRRALPRLPRRRPGGDPRAAPRPVPGDPPGASPAGRLPVAGAQLGADLRLAPRPPARRRGRACAPIYPDSRNPFAHPELLADGLEDWTVSEIWIDGRAEHLLNHYVDVTDTLRPQGRRAAGPRQPDRPRRSRHAAQQLARGAGRRRRLGPGRLAEAFQVIAAV